MPKVKEPKELTTEEQEEISVAREKIKTHTAAIEELIERANRRESRFNELEASLSAWRAETEAELASLRQQYLEGETDIAALRDAYMELRVIADIEADVAVPKTAKRCGWRQSKGRRSGNDDWCDGRPKQHNPHANVCGFSFARRYRA